MFRSVVVGAALVSLLVACGAVPAAVPVAPTATPDLDARIAGLPPAEATVALAGLRALALAANTLAAVGPISDAPSSGEDRGQLAAAQMGQLAPAMQQAELRAAADGASPAACPALLTSALLTAASSLVFDAAQAPEHLARDRAVVRDSLSPALRASVLALVDGADQPAVSAGTIAALHEVAYGQALPCPVAPPTGS